MSLLHWAYYLGILLLTLLIEVPVAWLLLRHHGEAGDGQYKKRIIVAALLGTGLTHPFMHFYLAFHLGFLGTQLILLGESTALVVEALIFALIVRPVPRYHAVIASAGANATSYVFGLALFGIIDLFR